MIQSRVPQDLRAGVSALMILMGTGMAGYIVHDKRTESLMQHEYVLAVAGDETSSRAVKVAMVMGSYYESSYRHIGTPYVDKLGRGQPLTVCNGLTGADVVAGRSYSPADCYRLERVRYLGHERWLASDVPRWSDLPLFVQVTVLDFLHNKGASAFASSTMRRKLVAGNLEGACAENERWNRGTVAGVSTVLPGLDVRGKSNAEICLWADPQQVPVAPASASALVAAQATAEGVPAGASTAITPQAAPHSWWRRLLPGARP